MSLIFRGIDWAEGHHDIALVDQHGTPLAKLRISDDSAGFHALTELLARHGDSAVDPIPVAIETPRGLLVAALRATGRRVYATGLSALLGAVRIARSHGADLYLHAVPTRLAKLLRVSHTRAAPSSSSTTVNAGVEGGRGWGRALG